jgi:hypothetical protein
MADILPPAPLGSPFGSYAWSDWYQKVRTVINAGSNIPHNSLSGLQGGGSGNFYHLDSAQLAGLNSLIASSTTDWIYLKVSADFTTSSSSPVDIPGLAFTPLASNTMIVEGMLLLSSSSTTLGVKPGVSWPSGLNYGAAKINSTNGSNTDVIINTTYSTNSSAPGTDMPTANNPYLAEVKATMSVSSTPVGQFKVTVSTE